MALFLCPKGHWLIRAMRGTGKAAPVALHGEGGYSLSRKRVSPLTPREKGRGAFPLDPAALAVLGLKSYAACGIGCGVRGFATGPYVSSPLATAPYYREARVTMAQRQTLCGAALLRSPRVGSLLFYFNSVLFCKLPAAFGIRTG